MQNGHPADSISRGVRCSVASQTAHKCVLFRFLLSHRLIGPLGRDHTRDHEAMFDPGVSAPNSSCVHAKLIVSNPSRFTQNPDMLDFWGILMHTMLQAEALHERACVVIFNGPCSSTAHAGTDDVD